MIDGSHGKPYSDFWMADGKCLELFPPFCSLSGWKYHIEKAHYFCDNAIDDASGAFIGQRALGSDLSHFYIKLGRVEDGVEETNKARLTAYL
jgi:hypothetical protein